jgi:hypothetical protein
MAALMLAASASAAFAQTKGQWEFGTDFLGFNNNSPDGGTSSTTLNFMSPTGVRVGKMITDKISIEPMVTFISSGPSGSKFTGTTFEVSALYHLKAMSGEAPGWYVRPGIGMSSFKFSGSSSVSRTNFGVAVGMKKKTSNILIIRAEGYFWMTPEKDTSPSETDIGLRAGLSVIP